MESAGEPRMRAVCRLCAEVAAVSGAGLTLILSNDSGAPVCASNEISARIEDLQYTLGEGPCIDAHRRGGAVAEPDLANPRVARWPTFSAPAIEAGASAVFAFPLRVGAVRLGALTLYQSVTGPLGDARYADAVAMADVATHEILVFHSDSLSEASTELAALGAYRAEVHQASGMVARQLGTSVSESLVRLRAHAFAEGRPLAEVAADVVARRLLLAR